MELTTVFFKTLLFYSLAEYQAGHVSRIDISIKDNKISISDNGRGHATNKMIDGVPYLKMVYNQLHMPFENAMPTIQLHALGMSIINDLADSLEVKIFKKDKIEIHQFEKGQHVNSIEQDNSFDRTGNTITLRISEKPNNKLIDVQAIKKYLLTIKGVCKYLEETYNTSLQNVWAAITEAEQMQIWYFGQIKSFTPKEGFSTEFLVENKGRKFTHLWKVIEVKVYHKIKYQWRYKEYPGDSVVTFELAEIF